MEIHGKVTDGVTDFHARMADGRVFTDYRSNCVMNSSLSNNKDSFEYRMYLINTGSNLIKQMNSQMENRVRCTTCKTTDVLPIQNVQNCNKGICNISQVNANGVGLDRANTYL